MARLASFRIRGLPVSVGIMGDLDYHQIVRLPQEEYLTDLAKKPLPLFARGCSFLVKNSQNRGKIAWFTP